ncbi:MAG TPA: adenylate/guanylate cyclase domain-containing protein, partial [Myxococcota bacterium]|nr:adenylate/guanylate cyclase domain-containing protein [Myxococcota bacterium]
PMKVAGETLRLTVRDVIERHNGAYWFERERIRQVFGRYVSEEVARKLLADGGDRARRGEQREVTILFSDLRGYSTLSERLTPSQVLEIMNEYLELMNQVIAAHGGCIIEYTGDGVLAVFGAPDDLPNHPERAVRAAFAMRDSLAALNLRWEHEGTSRLWQEHGIDAIAARIGIHTGLVVAGSLGSSLRMKYTILGDSVNIASRLEGKNKELGTDILVSEAVFSRLPGDLKQRAKSQGEHSVKGRQQPVALYSF